MKLQESRVLSILSSKESQGQTKQLEIQLMAHIFDD